nr:MAG TPA: hypothetical protein [Bacteriophage sp.]
MPHCIRVLLTVTVKIPVVLLYDLPILLATVLLDIPLRPVKLSVSTKKSFRVNF